MKDNVYKTNDGILKMEFIGWEEPNNGRELIIPKISKQDIDITQEICKNWNGWNRIPMYIDFDFSHPKIPIVFIPFEKNFILYNYDIDQISIIELNSNLRNNSFVKNKFYEERIIFVTSRIIKIKNLLTNKYYKYEAQENEFFEDAEITIDNFLKIHRNNIEIKGNQINIIEENVLLIDLKNVV